MARLLIKGATRFLNPACPRVPYYKIHIDVFSTANNTERKTGDVIFNYENKRWNWRWASDEVIEYLDMRWQNEIEKQVEAYCEEKLSKE